MTSSKLINYTTREFMSDHELEQYIAKQNEIFTPKVVEEFNKAGMLRRVLTKLWNKDCLLYTSPSPRDLWISRMPSSA